MKLSQKMKLYQILELTIRIFCREITDRRTNS